MSLSPCSSRSSLIWNTTRRYLATRYRSNSSNSTSTSTNEVAEPSSSSNHDDKSISKRKSIEPLYKNSNAAARPRPNLRTSLYASTPLRGRIVGGELKLRGEGEENGEDANYNVELAMNAALKTSQAKSDERLNRQYRRLMELPRNDAEGVFGTIEIIKQIKKQLQTNHSLEGGKMPKPPFFVFVVQLERYAKAGELELCRAVLVDMEHFQYSVTVEALNYLLQAAIVKMNEEEIEDILEEISRLDGGGLETQIRPILTNSNQPVLSKEWTKNWTVVTYQHLLGFCRHAHNTVEYTLALLASASHRHQEGGDEATFLSAVLNLHTIIDVLHTLAHDREPRLMLEVALWMDNIIGSRKLSAANWVNILRHCATEHYFPGIEVAWQEAVVKGFLSPDDGCIVLILVAAARANKTKFIEKVLAFHEARLEKIGLFLQENHLMPLFQSQCADYNFVAALKTVTRIARTNPPTMTALIDLRHAASISENRLKEAYDAMMTVGRDKSHEGGICMSAFNNLIAAAQALDDLGMALKIFRSRRFIRGESSPKDFSLAPLTGFEEEADSDDWKYTGEPKPLSSSSVKREVSVQADVETYNLLLLCAFRMKEEGVAQDLYRHMNAEKVKANPRTYELGINLALLKDDYQPGFLLLEECKKRKLIPTRWCYLHLAYRCREVDDPRWIDLTLEMIGIGHTPGEKLYRRLTMEGYTEQIPSEKRESLDGIYRRHEWDPIYTESKSLLRNDAE